MAVSWHSGALHLVLMLCPVALADRQQTLEAAWKPEMPKARSAAEVCAEVDKLDPMPLNDPGTL